MIYNDISFCCHMCVVVGRNLDGMGIKLGQWPKSENDRQLFYLSILCLSNDWHLFFFYLLFIRKN